MDAVTSSMLVILLVFGFGLAGASYDTCKDTLTNNGYNMSDSQYHSFYEAANDPDNINYINTHADTLSNDWSQIITGETSLSDWYDNYVIEASGNTSGTTSPVDSQWVENGVTESVTVWDDDLRADAYLQQYGKPGTRTISDGHGGYYQAVLSSSDLGISYYVVHYDVDGRKKVLYNILEGMPESYKYLYFDFHVVELEDGTQRAIVEKTYRRPPHDDETFVKSEESIITFSNEKIGEIEEKKTGETTDVAINPDGSITLPDGTLVYPNSDGTYTINGTDYTPSTILPDINDLLKQLLDLQEQIKDLENSLQFDKDKADSFDVSESVDAAVGSYEGDLSEFLLNSRITQVFPFCLPFDFVRGLKLISSSPVPPKFDINFDIPSFGAYPGSHNVITLDLGVYSKYFNVVRWVSTVLFIISLCFLTHKLIKW